MIEFLVIALGLLLIVMGRKKHNSLMVIVGWIFLFLGIAALWKFFSVDSFFS
jgi:hypothetical protein